MLDKETIMNVLDDINIEIDDQCVILNPIDGDLVELVFEGTAGECIDFINTAPEGDTIMALRSEFEKREPVLQHLH